MYPVRFFVRAAPVRIAGLFSSDRHLFGTDSPTPLFLFGSDEYGRDLFSRLLYGGQISLFAGLLGAALSLGIGVVLGGIAGFYGGWVDEIIMRAAELFLALPWLYLLFAVRMSLPLQIAPAQAFLLIVTVIGVVGWARPARLIRGVVLSARTRDYVLAARCAGASDPYLLRRHVLPQIVGIALTQAAVLAPQYVLAEVTLSFFGLGVGEPVPSWGNMLSSLHRYHVLASYWWMFLPGIALIPVFLLYYALADALHQRASTRIELTCGRSQEAGPFDEQTVCRIARRSPSARRRRRDARRARTASDCRRRLPRRPGRNGARRAASSSSSSAPNRERSIPSPRSTARRATCSGGCTRT